MRLVVIDNQDSFTWNLVHLLGMKLGLLPVVVDHRASLEQLRALSPQALVLSPGPGRPDRPSDFGLCAEAIAHVDLPLLGVCLGHQGLGLFGGAKLQPAPAVMHGYRSQIYHNDDELMFGVAQGAFAVRYHSLCIGDLPPTLERIAWTDDDVVMGIRVKGRSRWGVQFHPESILTQFGERLAENFVREAHVANRLEWSPRGQQVRAHAATVSPTPPLVVCSRALPSCPDPAHVYRHVFGSHDAFWFDSALDRRARYSYMGLLGDSASFSDIEGRVTPPSELERSGDGFRTPFVGGWVCALAYEEFDEATAGSCERASLIREVRRWFGWDHVERQFALFALVADDLEHRRAQAWFDEMSAVVEGLPSMPQLAPIRSQTQTAPVHFSCSDEVYRQRVIKAKAALVAGESYELCLTDRASFTIEDDPLEYYLRLRAHNPAPYAAFIRDGDRVVASVSPELFLQIDSSGRCTARPIKGTAPRSEQPSVDQGYAAELRMPRFVAENLMIVDLLRNDLGRVSELGSVQVPRLMEVETHPNVHQLVSTIVGQLRSELVATDVIRAAFPGGSMTGAPKRRSMEILAELEGQPRGLYSGALGYVGADGQVMLSIVIRTAVFDGRSATVGSGGAIVMASEPDDELREAKLKVRPLLACRTPQP